MSSFLPVLMGTRSSGVKVHWRPVLLLVAVTTCGQRRPVVLWGPGSSQTTLLGGEPCPPPTFDL